LPYAPLFSGGTKVIIYGIGYFWEKQHQMKTDLYTKIILTVIAAALSVQTLHRLITPDEAHAGPANFNRFSGPAVNEDGSINVRMASDMDVNIRSVGGSSVYGALPVNLKELAGSSFYGTLPVNIKEVSGSSVSSNGLPVNIESVDGMSVYSAVPVKDMK
jgi:hypothetical protein